MVDRKVIAIGIMLALLTAGWIAYATNSAAATPATASITVTARDFQYEPATIRVRTGQAVNLTFRNASTTMVHELRLQGFNVETKAGPGFENTQTFVATTPGSYKFTCNLPGHEAMVGELTVQ